MEYKFKAEVKQVLDIVVNSLYTDKEIFIRELVSNASDASEKYRFAALSKKQDVKPEDLKITLLGDEKAGTFSIEDSGVGMTNEELLENLGTIAHSGSKAFVEALKNNKGDFAQNLIGQFGVGFYSVFMVADKVEVETKSEDGEALKWTCLGDENFTIESCEKSSRGTKITATLKEEYKEFASAERIKEIVNKYSAYVEFPISVNGEEIKARSAIWLKNKSELKDSDYEDFYKFQTRSYDAPIDWLHFQADAPVELNALIYTPTSNPEILGFGKIKNEVGLYCKKVLIDPSPKNMFPEWMRFARGVVDSADIPLNISRESMQDSSLVAKIGRMVLRRYIKHLAEVAKKDSKKFDEIFAKIGRFLKEGAASDFDNREELSKLLRFESSLFADGTKVSLADYVSRMKDSQKQIFYACGLDRQTIEASPYIEAFSARGLEVLYFYDPVDSFVIGNLAEFDKKPFASADSAELDLGDAPNANSSEEPLAKDELDALAKWLKETLGEKKVSEVLTQGRLVDSPVAALNADTLTPQMRAMLKAMNPDSPMPDPIVKLEINPKSPVIKNLAQLREKDANLAEEVALQLYDNAMLAAGLLENPRAMAKRLNNILAHIKGS